MVQELEYEKSMHVFIPLEKKSSQWQPGDEIFRESEERYRTILESINEVYYEVDISGNLTFFTNELCKILGYSENELMGMNNRSYMDEEYSKEVFQAYHHAFNTGSPANGLNIKLIRKDGAPRYVETSIALMKDKNGQPVGFRGVCRDITHRKEAEEVLRKSEERYRTILECIVDGYFEVDIAGNYTFVNDALCKMRGYSESELMGTNNRQYTDPETAKMVYSYFNRVYTTGRPVTGLVYKTFKKDGTEIFVESSVSLMKDKDDQITGFRAMVRDITERKKIEDLFTIRNRFAEIFITVPDDDMYKEILKVIVEVMNSMYGMLGYIDENGSLVIPSMTQYLWDLCQVPQKTAVFAHDTWKDSTWSRAIKEKRYLYSNEPSLNIPEGHISILRHISLPIIYQGKAIGLFMVANKYTDYTDEDVKRLETIAAEISPILNAKIQQQIEERGRKQAEEKTKKSLEKLRRSTEKIISAMALTVETRDPYTAGHQKRVADLARSIAKEMGLSEDQIDGIRMAGRIHDIGKLAVPSDILSKPSRLSELEFGIIKTHPEAAYDILKDIEFDWPIAQIVLQHHERLDGSGYPHRLSGENILLESRVLAVADVVEAMAFHRPYRPALGPEKAIEEITQHKGIQYDPDVVDACLKVLINYEFQKDY